MCRGQLSARIAPNFGRFFQMNFFVDIRRDSDRDGGGQMIMSYRIKYVVTRVVIVCNCLTMPVQQASADQPTNSPYSSHASVVFAKTSVKHSHKWLVLRRRTYAAALYEIFPTKSYYIFTRHRKLARKKFVLVYTLCITHLILKFHLGMRIATINYTLIELFLYYLRVESLLDCVEEIKAIKMFRYIVKTSGSKRHFRY